MRRRIGLRGAALCAGLALLATAAPALAQPPHCPPGHAKKGWCDPRVDGLPPGLRLRDWDGWRERGLREPRRGERWVTVDGEAYLILDATRQVLEAAGAVDRLLRD